MEKERESTHDMRFADQVSHPYYFIYSNNIYMYIYICQTSFRLYLFKKQNPHGKALVGLPVRVNGCVNSAEPGTAAAEFDWHSSEPRGGSQRIVVGHYVG